MKKGNISIFVPHVGCRHKCSFCNQIHISGTVALPGPQDVHRAVQQAMAHPNFGNYSCEIAFFGGSFTAVSKDYMDTMLQAASGYVKQGVVTGIRCSTRPDAMDADMARHLKEYGVTTIEFGAQCMDNLVLQKNGRGHTVEDVVRASHCVQQEGIALGLQMMTGLPYSSPKIDINTAKQIIQLKPDCVRIYPTIVVRDTQLYNWYSSGEYTPPTLQQSVDLVSKLLKMFYDRDISVIRVGLHRDEDLIQNMVAGPYHESFRELCEGQIYRDLLQKDLSCFVKGRVVVHVHPSHVSRLMGHSGCNRQYFLQKGYHIVPKADDSISKFTVKCEEPVCF